MKSIRHYPVALREVHWTFVEAFCDSAPDGFFVPTFELADALVEAGFKKVSDTWLDDTGSSFETWQVDDGDPNEDNQRLFDACKGFAHLQIPSPKGANRFVWHISRPGRQEWNLVLDRYPPDTVRHVECRAPSRDVRHSRLVYDVETGACLGKLHLSTFRKGLWVQVRKAGTGRARNHYFRSDHEAAVFMRKAYSIGCHVIGSDKQ